jgi:RNA polymerase sigma-70 factor (ECF subfamily)
VDEPAESANEPDARGARSIIGALEDARELFASLVDDIRPDLHRYLARMTGSRADGEDLVQDTLARAYYQISEFKELPPLRPWLFRIAHNLAIDHHRRIGYRAAAPLDEAAGVAGDEALRPDSVLARNQAVRLAVASFLAVAPAQRACVILKDVLDHTLDEIADLLGLSVPAVKAALHRGRSALASVPVLLPLPVGPHAPTLVRYSELFNAHDWDGVRAMLAEDVRLDVVSRAKAAGKRDVGRYFTNYERLAQWHMAPAWLDGREVIAVYRDATAPRPDYFVLLSLRGDQVAAIQDFRHVDYILEGDQAAIVREGLPRRAD